MHSASISSKLLTWYLIICCRFLNIMRIIIVIYILIPAYSEWRKSVRMIPEMLPRIYSSNSVSKLRHVHILNIINLGRICIESLIFSVISLVRILFICCCAPTLIQRKLSSRLSLTTTKFLRGIQNLWNLLIFMKWFIKIFFSIWGLFILMNFFNLQLGYSLKVNLFLSWLSLIQLPVSIYEWISFWKKVLTCDKYSILLIFFILFYKNKKVNLPKNKELYIYWA